MRRFILLFVSVLTLGAVTSPATLADLTGDASTHPVSATSIHAWTVDLTALATNSAACRIGDSNTTSSRGQVIAAGGSYHFQGRPSATNVNAKDQAFDLSTIYYNCGSGDKLTVMYAPQ